MRLKEIRKKRSITQLKLALDLNISQNTISRYETGKREADYATLIRLADYFNVSLDYLLERTDNPTFYKARPKKDALYRGRYRKNVFCRKARHVFLFVIS